MAFLKYNGIGITALAAAIPRQVIDNYKYTQYFPENQVKLVVDKSSNVVLLMRKPVQATFVSLPQKS